MVSNTPIPLIGSNAHTHTTFCDGHDSARTMLDAAINKGFFALGFSSHSYLDQEDWTMTRQGTLDYIARIRQLKEDENGRIRVYLGTELDAMSDVDLTPYDYLVASVHNIYADPAALSARCGKPVLSLEVTNTFTTLGIPPTQIYSLKYLIIALCVVSLILVRLRYESLR